MPRYEYECCYCLQFSRRTVPVEQRDEQCCEACGDYCHRKFTPTTNILIPAHFKDVSSASWMLPDDPKTEIGDRASRARIASPAERKSFKPKLLEAIKHL